MREAAKQNSRATRVVLSIVNHGHEADIERLLASLDAHLVDDGLDVTIIVTDNAADRSDIDLTSRFLIRRIQNAVPKGFGANHNQAFESAECDWFVVLNPDIWLQERLDLCMLSSATIADTIISAKIENPDGSTADFQRAYVTPLALWRRWLARARTAETAMWYAAIFLAFPSRVYDATGGFDEGYFMYVEDCDLCWRAHRLGVPLAVQCDWRVRHHAGRASRRSIRHMRWHLAGLVRFWRKFAFRSLQDWLGGIFGVRP